MADIKNFIDQIKIGETTYDIATKRSIKFTNGGVETEWNGLSDITVAIPSISDLVQSPIVFAGTVDKSGINWSEGYSAPALKGYLLFVTETCTIDSGDSDSDFATVTCEKGDMAIYDGSKWNIVSGENQVKIVGGSAGDIAEKISVEIGSAKDVLVVEGKALTLSLDYADINRHISKTKGEDTKTVDLTKAKVNNQYIKLNATDKSTTIGDEVELKNITGVKDSTVTFSVTDSEDGQLVNSVDFGTYTDGTLPTFKMNDSAVELDIKGDSLTAISDNNNGDFVSSVAMNDVTFIEDGEGKTAVDNITVVDGISESEGDDFLKGMHITVKGENDAEDEVADLTIEYIAPVDGVSATFVTGLTEGTDVVTEVTGGAFTLVDGGADVVTGFGDEISDNSGDVLTDVTVNASSESVLKEAKVENHVLSFEAIKVTSDVSLSHKSKSLTKKGVSHTPINVTKKGLATKGFTTNNIELTFDKGKETVYTPTFKTWKLNTPELTVNKGSYEMGDITASIPANSFVSEMTVGELPSWTGAEVKYASLTGSVKHEMEYGDDIVLNVLTDTSIKLPTYTIVSAESEEEGVTVTVGKAGSLTGSGSVNLSEYIKDITIE